MARRNNNHNQSNASTGNASSPPAILFWLGALFLLISIGASLVLALDHFDLSKAPGCGPDSGCDQAAKSAWGKIPGLNWPVSLLGLAYFVSIFIGWLMSGKGTSGAFRWIVRLGALISAMYTVVMITGGYVCAYCLAAHLANFAFLLVMEIAAGPRPAPAWGAQLATLATVFVVSTGVLGAIEWKTSEARAEKAEGELAESTQKIIQKTTQTSNQSAETTTTSSLSIDREEGFTGRYRMGPENAPIRIVMFMDYQCVDCDAIEDQVRQLFQERDDISLSVKHFPFSSKCNPHVSVDPHPNACWAARVAEAAGILGGNDVFWKMHEWLFDKDGGFNHIELHLGADELKLDFDSLVAIMEGQETLRRVQTDIDEALSYGLHYTPMIFVNGVDLKGFTAPNALIRMVEKVAETNPAPGSPHDDWPPSAADKYFEDWRKGIVRAVPDDLLAWTYGREMGKVEVVVFSDYQWPTTATLDDVIRSIVDKRSDTRYIFRHYPIDQACNQYAVRTRQPQACLASKAAEAAGMLGGRDAYWAIHSWILKNQTNLTHDNLVNEAVKIGLVKEEFIAAMESDRVRMLINDDIESGRALTTTGVPAVFVNRKHVPRWDLKGHNVLQRIIEHASVHGADQGLN